MDHHADSSQPPSDPPNRQHRLFIIGTLRNGQQNYSRLRGLAIVNDPHSISGNLMIINPHFYNRLLADLDQIESYNQDAHRVQKSCIDFQWRPGQVPVKTHLRDAIGVF